MLQRVSDVASNRESNGTNLQGSSGETMAGRYMLASQPTISRERILGTHSSR